jgi:hypothetical protein
VHNIKEIRASIMAQGGEMDELIRELQATHKPV